MNRPFPPKRLFNLEGLDSFERAHDVEDWLYEVFVDYNSPLYGEEHEHLEEAGIGVLWSTASVVRKGIAIAGTAELAKPKNSLGQLEKKIWMWQQRQWFGDDPLHFRITLDANYAMECEDVDFCALVKHELCHCAQALNKYGDKWFRKDGSRVFTLIGHDVEEFIPVVRDFGPVGRNVREFVAAASAPPRIAQAHIARMCGTVARAA